jgi:3-oxoacyl-[acyl-carrier-protein] synthase II
MDRRSGDPKMNHRVVITGLGMVTPLGRSADDVLAAMACGRLAAAPPVGFDISPLDCKLAAQIHDFDANDYFPDNKTLRLMNRDAQLAVAAARLAVGDAGLNIGEDYPADKVSLFGSTGLAGMPAGAIAALVKNSADSNGALDLGSFGRTALKRVRPVLSFKILANMPLCFVSIFEGICGPNAIYTPWEGQGARAIQAGFRAVRTGRTPCALAGGCDTKAHAFGFVSLQQLGIFDSWNACGTGTVPGEGSAFLVLESEQSARDRGADVYCRLTDCSAGTVCDEDHADKCARIMAALGPARPDLLIAAGDGQPKLRRREQQAIDELCPRAEIIRPKKHMGDLFAAAAAVQIALAARSVSLAGPKAVAWANCFGHGSEVASFSVEAA